jgi:hypothetical protein
MDTNQERLLFRDEVFQIDTDVIGLRRISMFAIPCRNEAAVGAPSPENIAERINRWEKILVER